MKIYSLLLLLAFVISLSAREEKYIYFIFSQNCYDSLINQADYMNKKCLMEALSKFLGYGLVIGGGIVKIPQLIRIFLDKSVYGLSYSSILLQSATNWITIIYSWHHDIPFSIYGENAFILIQNIMIIFTFILFGYKLPQKSSFSPTNFYFAMFGIIAVVLYCTQDPNRWPLLLIQNIMYFQILLFSCARIAQIWHIYKCKSTGSLSLITSSLICLGNLGRLFTIFVQINDMMFATSVIIATVLNYTILVQFFIYWKNKPEKNDKQD